MTRGVEITSDVMRNIKRSFTLHAKRGKGQVHFSKDDEGKWGYTFDGEKARYVYDFNTLTQLAPDYTIEIKEGEREE